ncbi:MAG: FHA domain-containing protein [Chthoniobacteraceae bacterium]
MPKLQVFLPDGGGEVSHDLTGDTITIGRLSDNTIQIDNISVSSHHAELTLSGGDYHLKDMNSTNGTFLNGKPLTEALLSAGAKVRFGNIETIYQSDIHAPSEKRELPAPEIAPVVPASMSARPRDFSNAAPFKIKKEKKSGAGSAIVAVAVLSILACGGAIAYILMMQPPQ